MKHIELKELTKDGEVHNLSGHDRGLAARKRFNIAELDRSNDPVVVDVPEFIYAISSSFFQGMFAESVRYFGERDKFLDKYTFNANSVVRKQIDSGIKASLMKRENLFSDREFN